MPQPHNNDLHTSNRTTDLASRIQSTLISNTITEASWQKHIDDCLQFRFHAAMVPPCWIKRTAQALSGRGIRVASFIDLPFGTMLTASKAFEAAQMVDEGVNEIDLMPNVGFLLSGLEREYYADISEVVRAAKNTPIKVMLELPLLTPQQRDRAVQISVEAGVAYLKNASSGAVGIAQPSEIEYLRRIAPPHVHVKASGGIKTVQQVQDLVAAGADLVGTSAGSAIMKEFLTGTFSADSQHSHY
jgi:deoxyribose-phosphate aldolase